MKECCKNQTTPFCPQCGTKLEPFDPLKSLLTFLRTHEKSSKHRTRHLKWKQWADAVEEAVKLKVANETVISAFHPSKCSECSNSGYRVHPQNGQVSGVRCSRGCRVNCSVCNDPDCDNPDGQH